MSADVSIEANTAIDLLHTVVSRRQQEPSADRPWPLGSL